jgi:nucleoside-diphosphate-sugar epimerase
MKIVVTGAAGFIGSAIVEGLLEQGKHAIAAIDNMSASPREAWKALEDDAIASRGGLDLCECDAGDASNPALARIYAKADAIVHCAAYADVSGNWRDEHEPGRQWDANANLVQRVLYLTPNGATFVLLSSCAVYPPGCSDETTVPLAESPYAAAKLGAEALVAAYTAAHRLKGISLRLVSAVGPNYRHGHIADFVHSVARAGAIHGKDNGRKRRSMIHVGDVVDYVLSVLGGECANHLNVRNVTSPYRWSWWDTIEVMRAMRPERRFDVTCEDQESGWVGDSAELVASTVYTRPKIAHRSIVRGVVEALNGLGW